MENLVLINIYIWCWDKEPLALPNKRAGLAAVTILSFAFLAALQSANKLRFEGLFRGDDAAYGGTFRYAGHKPMPLVVTTKELVLPVGQATAFCGLPDHEQQVAVFRLKVENKNVGIVVRLDVEELPSSIVGDVNDDRTSGGAPAVSCERAQLNSSAEFLEFGLNEVCVHAVMDTRGGPEVRRSRRPTETDQRRLRQNRCGYVIVFLQWGLARKG